ncbi:MAG: phosphoenolpyruvate synthase [Gammaproteobacteria bacterium]|nr:phosphoenolpyruvate synthase [Gammaproteobacteria bacterium]
MPFPMRLACLPLLLSLLPSPSPAADPSTGAVADDSLRERIAALKLAERGPFARIRWFCKDGSVLPPTPYGCKDYGGGSQHGEWTEEVKRLRAKGYLIANVYSDLDVDALARDLDAPDQIGQMLIEQFLVNIDDGWILRRARYYRGALQEEGERKGTRRLLFRLAEDPHWLRSRYVLLRAAARLLPHGRETHTAAEVRQHAADLASRDQAFATLRNKIHVRPEAGDAVTVRAYAARVADAGLAAEYERLATAIDAAYSGRTVIEMLAALIADFSSLEQLREALAGAAERLRHSTAAAERLGIAAELLVLLREQALAPNGPQSRVDLLDASIAVENEFFVAANAVLNDLPQMSRRELARLALVSARAAYGAGLISARERDALAAEVMSLDAERAPRVARYKRAADYLGLVPAWATQQLRLHFGVATERYLELEPRADLFIQDQLRGSPMFFYAQVVERLARDAQRLAGVRNELFAEDVGAGLRSLNPGLARGVLQVVTAAGEAGDYAADGIYLLPETVSDLPPVAGILTAGEGNPLSHVQLLARNLGIPNVAVDGGLLGRLRAHDGARIVLAVSPAGSVRVALDDGRFDELFARGEAASDVVIRPDLDKLDLDRSDPIDLAELRATDSGRIVGPKAAKLGELKHNYPEAVADGIAIPFGVFRALLDAPYEGGGETIFEWMVRGYRELAQMPRESAQWHTAAQTLRAGIEARIAASTVPPGLAAALSERLAAMLGPSGSYGVFVRSDTNVEDLPGFTGAGLNLTLPNVVGIDAILTAIPRVWASPFTARAFAWRQAHMESPEHVYPAVLLLESVPSDKSGVLVTQDIDTGAAGWLSVAVNEGVGGAVDGQAAESLRIEMATGRTRLLAQATAPRRRVLNPRGGVEELRSSGADTVLEPQEIGQLIEFARELPQRFASIVDDAGRPAPADVEFGFVNGRLRLFQIRPFLESRGARGSKYLASLDEALAQYEQQEVDLDATP